MVATSFMSVMAISISFAGGASPFTAATTMTRCTSANSDDNDSDNDRYELGISTEAPGNTGSSRFRKTSGGTTFGKFHYSGIEHFSLTANDFENAIDVRNVAADTWLTVNGGGNDDQFFVGGRRSTGH